MPYRDDRDIQRSSISREDLRDAFREFGNHFGQQVNRQIEERVREEVSYQLDERLGSRGNQRAYVEDSYGGYRNEPWRPPFWMTLTGGFLVLVTVGYATTKQPVQTQPVYRSDMVPQPQAPTQTPISTPPSQPVYSVPVQPQQTYPSPSPRLKSPGEKQCSSATTQIAELCQ